MLHLLNIFQHMYPDTNMHELDLSWILKEVAEFDRQLDELEERVIEAAVKASKEYIDAQVAEIRTEFEELSNQVNNLSIQFNQTVEELQTQYTTFVTAVDNSINRLVHRIEDFENADCVIKNPGVKFEGNKFLQAAKNIETDLSIFLRFTECPIIAVTGSKGKSSTVSAIHYGLKQAGFNAFLGGNITVSPLTFFDEVSKETPVVLELSSWQLADLRGRNVLKPFISIITKIVPDHQNWYGNMEDYVKDKRLIYADQICTKENSCYSIFDAEGDEVGQEPDKNLHSESSWGQLFANESKACVLRYGKSKLDDGVFGAWLEETKDSKAYGKVFLPGMKEPECILNGLSVPGEHMKTNVLNGALTLFLMGVDAEKIVEICKNWPGIDHRLQYFHTWNKNGALYKFYNDSCATVPEAAAMATQAFGKSVILFTGGTEKGLSLKPLIDVLKNRGKILSIEKDVNNDKAWEIWLKIEKEPFVYYLFNCDDFVIQC